MSTSGRLLYVFAWFIALAAIAAGALYLFASGRDLLAIFIGMAVVASGARFAFLLVRAYPQTPGLGKR